MKRIDSIAATRGQLHPTNMTAQRCHIAFTACQPSLGIPLVTQTGRRRNFTSITWQSAVRMIRTEMASAGTQQPALPPPVAAVGINV